MNEVATYEDSSEWSRGVLASYEDVTPPRRRATDALESRLTDVELRLTRIENTPVDATKVTFTAKTMIAIVAAAITVVLSQLAMNAALKEDVLKAVAESTQKQDKKFTDQEKAIDDLRKEFRLLQMNVTDFMINNKRRTQP